MEDIHFSLVYMNTSYDPPVCKDLSILPLLAYGFAGKLASENEESGDILSGVAKIYFYSGSTCQPLPGG